jgi:hypothetical protein
VWLKPFSLFCPYGLILVIGLFVIVIGSSSSNHVNYNKAFAAPNASPTLNSTSSTRAAQQQQQQQQQTTSSTSSQTATTGSVNTSSLSLSLSPQPLLKQGQQQQQQQPLQSPPSQSYAQQPLYPYPYQYPYQQQQQQQQQPVQSQQQQQEVLSPSVSSSSPPPPQQPLVPPIAKAGVSEIADANTNVMLDGRNSFVPILQQQANTTTIAGINNNKTIIAYQWTQIPVGVPVTMTGANTPTPTFTAPMISYDTTLAFSLQVMSNDGQVSSNQAIVYVMVKHYTGANGGISSGIPQQQQPLLQPQQQPQQQVSPPSLQQPQSPPTTPTYPYQYPSPYTYRPNP